ARGDDVDARRPLGAAGECDLGSVGRPGGRIVVGGAVRQALLSGPVRPHQPDVRVLSGADARDPLPVRRPGRLGGVGYPGQPAKPGPAGADDEDLPRLRATASYRAPERDLRARGRPGRIEVDSRMPRQAPQAGAVEVHDVDLLVAADSPCEGDPTA